MSHSSQEPSPVTTPRSAFSRFHSQCLCIMLLVIVWAALCWEPLVSLADDFGVRSSQPRTLEEYSERIYQREVKRRWKRVKEVYGEANPDLVVPWDGEHSPNTYLWDYFAPSFNCPYRERLGAFSEGGKVVCNWEALQKRVKERGHVNVLSFGVRGDISFEVALLARTHAIIHAFDPSVPALPTGEQTLHPKNGHGPGGIVFHRKGLKGNSLNYGGEQDWGPLEPLEDLAASVGVGAKERIDFLKIDCEGCEWGAFKHLNDTDILRSVDQLSIELHFPQHKKNAQGPGSGVREVFEFFEVVERAGLRAFSWEVNHNPSGYWGEKPWAIEYSFVRPSSDYLTHRPF